MVKSYIKSWLGIQNLEKEIEDIESRVEDNTKRLRELQPISVELTNRQREVLEVFLSNETGWIDVYDIAERLDTSRNNAGSIMSDLKNKVEFDIKTVENGKKLYQLPGSEKEKIFQNA